MDNKAVRKRNIQWLVGLYAGPTNFGKLIDRDQVQVSQWLGGKQIGDRLARHIEGKLGKPAGWLDIPQWNASGVAEPEAAAYQLTRPDFDKITGAVSVLSQYLAIVGDPAEWISDPILLKVSYAVVEEFGEAVTPTNVLDLTKRLADRLRAEKPKDERTTAGAGDAAGKTNRRTTTRAR